MTMQMQDLRDLYVQKLQSIYDAEQQGLQAMGQMSQVVQNPQLKQGMEAHLQQTQRQVQRLEQLFQQMGQQPGGETNRAVQGLIAEGQKYMQGDMAPEVRDAALIAAQQAMEHYEMAGYGTARTYAQLLGEDQAAQMLEQTLEEEKMADEQLTQIARQINVQAMDR